MRDITVQSLRRERSISMVGAASSRGSPFFLFSSNTIPPTSFPDLSRFRFFCFATILLLYLQLLILLRVNKLSNRFKSNLILLMVVSSLCFVFKKIINFKKDSLKYCFDEKSKKSDALSIAESQPTPEPQAQKPVEKMLQSKEALRRIERYRLFEEFLNEQTHDDNFFSKQIQGDERAELMQGYYMLCVCSGSRWGGDKNDVFDLFWGNRIYNVVERQGVSTKKSFRTERGAFMKILLAPDGYMSVYIFGALIDNRNDEHLVQEDRVPVYRIVNHCDPSRLNDTSFLTRLWKSFMAFAEETQLDGSPSWTQRFRYWWIVTFKKSVDENGVLRESRFRRFAAWVAKWVLTVGLSGALLGMIQHCAARTDDYATSLDRIEHLCDSINKHIIEIQQN